MYIGMDKLQVLSLWYLTKKNLSSMNPVRDYKAFTDQSAEQ